MESGPPTSDGQGGIRSPARQDQARLSNRTPGPKPIRARTKRHLLTLDDASAEESGSASPAATGHPAEGDSIHGRRHDPEHDEADDDEIHDLALAAETSGLSTHGHEVTFPPSDDDQSETIRIVTEAVEHRRRRTAVERPPSAAEPSKRPRTDRPPRPRVRSDPRETRGPIRRRPCPDDPTIDPARPASAATEPAGTEPTDLLTQRNGGPIRHTLSTRPGDLDRPVDSAPAPARRARHGASFRWDDGAGFW